MRSTVAIDSPEELQQLLGINDINVRLFRRELNVTLTVRKGELRIDGEEEQVETARKVVEEALDRIRGGSPLDEEEVGALLRGGPEPERVLKESSETICRNRAHRNVAPRSRGQKDYVMAMRRKEVVLAIGPAGTGKTYLAVAMAVAMLREDVVRKIILTRPAVEAGEKLGFLPGGFEAKVNPYMRPLHDALHDLMDPVQIKKLAENDVIEVAPLAYMRGRTLSDAFIILDEGQNTTPAQMKMFLTRMGEGSRVVVTGDVTQIDLPRSFTSGLVHATRILKGIKEIEICHLSKGDIVRHKVVQRIVDAYEKKK
jgi:phosphate starvation-inducible PhoH-like protein